MKTKKIFAAVLVCAALANSSDVFAKASSPEDDLPAESPVQAANPAKTATPLTDTNLQIFYDFGQDRNYFTITYEMFHPDLWGNTFFFVDVDMNFVGGDGKNIGPSGAYTELSRSLNFWQNSAAKDFSLQVEYNGGLGAFNGGSYPINHSFLFGGNYFLHSRDYRHTLTLQLLYRYTLGQVNIVPMQFTAVWGCKDLFHAKGLTFSGYLDVFGDGGKCVVQSEPQLWYSVGQWFNCPNLNIGTEVELSVNFAGADGFRCRPCAGLKWVF